MPDLPRKNEVSPLTQAFALMTGRPKEARDKIRLRAAMLEETQRIAHIGYWERDLKTDRLILSDEAYRILGLAPREVTIALEEVTDRLHPDDRAIWSSVLAEALRGTARYDVSFRVIRPDGEIRFVHS